MPIPAAKDARGTNYIVCESLSTHNFTHLLTAPGTFDAVVMQAELDRLNLRGIKIVRIFCSYWNFIINRASYDAVLKLISAKLVANGQKALAVLFDGVTGSAVPAVDPKEEPWYDLLAAHPVGGWDPAAAANPTLFNGVNGKFDAWIALDLAGFAGFNPYTDLTGGGWLGTPGNLYLSIYPHDETIYPNLPSDSRYGSADQVALHGAFWTSMKDWIDTTITALNDAGAGLWALDMGNELAIADTGAAVVWADSTLSQEFSAQVKNPAVVGGLASVETFLRRIGFMKWFMAYVRDAHPTIEMTAGCLGEAYMILENEALDFDFLSVHDYGPGYIVGEQVPNSLDAFKDYGTLTGKDVCVNEYGTLVTGSRQIVRSWYEHQQRSLGSIMWGWFESNGFSLPVISTVNWAPSANPLLTPFWVYPHTGLERSIGAVPTFQTRRSDLYGYAADFFSGVPIAKLEEWVTVEVAGLWTGGTRQFKVQDAGGTDLVPGIATEVNWRRLAVGNALRTLPIGQKWRGAPPYVNWYPGIGNALDTATQDTKIGVGSEVYDLTIAEVLAAPDGVFLIGGWFGDMTYDALSYETMILEPVIPLVTTKHYLLTGAIVSAHTHYKIVGSAETVGIKLNQTDPRFEGRRQSWLTMPCYEPGYFVSDTNLLSRDVGHVYTLPPADRVDPATDPDAWLEPTEANLRRMRVPSGFQNVCVRVTTSLAPVSDGFVLVAVTGVDCLLRLTEEYFKVDVLTTTLGDDRVWGEVALREIHGVRLVNIEEMAGTGAKLEIGWTFDLSPIDAETPFEHILWPVVNNAGATVDRGWRVGFPVQLHRDSLSGAMKTAEVDGFTFCNGDVKRTGSAIADLLEAEQGGSWGMDGEETHRKPKFEDGVFDLGANTWEPPQYARPVSNAGSNAGENPQQYRWYSFLLNVQPERPGGPLEA